MDKLILSLLFLCGLFLAGCSVRSSDSSFETVRTVIEDDLATFFYTLRT